MRMQFNVVQGRGEPQIIELEAPTLDLARQQLLSEGYTVLSLRQMGPAWQKLLRAPAPKIAIDVEVFVEQLRDLLGAGLNVVEALETLQRGASKRSLPLLERLTQRLRGGHRLSSALIEEPVFPRLLVALVRSSELTSDLAQALARFLEHQQRVAEVRHRVVSVAIYPLLLTAVGSGVLLFLLFYVMPRFARVFEGMSGALPWSARAMVWWTHWLNTHGAWLIGAFALMLVSIVALVSTSVGRTRVTKRLLDTVLARKHLRTYFLARWFRATGMLVEGGIPLPEALSLSIDLLPVGLQAAGAAVERGIRDGHSPTVAHMRAGMVTPVAEQLMHAGERTGDMGSVLTRIARFHDAEVARTLERVMRTIEPVVMVMVGIGVGAVVVLMYLPIFELASAIQ